MQYSLSTACCFTTAIAIVCAVTVLQSAFPYWTVLAGAFLVASCEVARRGSSTDLAWGLFSLGWLIALIDAASSLVGCFAFVGGPPPAHEMQARLWTAYASAVVLPLFLSFPAMYAPVQASHFSLSRAQKWMVASVLLAWIDCTLATVLIATAAGRWAS